MRGEYCDLVPLSTEAHAAELYEAYTAPVAMDLWTYTGPDTPPTESRERFEAWVAEDAHGGAWPCEGQNVGVGPAAVAGAHCSLK